MRHYIASLSSLRAASPDSYSTSHLITVANMNGILNAPSQPQRQVNTFMVAIRRALEAPKALDDSGAFVVLQLRNGSAHSLSCSNRGLCASIAGGDSSL